MSKFKVGIIVVRDVAAGAVVVGNPAHSLQCADHSFIPMASETRR